MKLPIQSIFIIAIATALIPLAAAEGTFKAGFAKVDVTPTEPTPMWGYGARKDALSMGTRDPLYAKALVIETDDGKAALIGLDLGRSFGDPEFTRMKEALAEKAGITLFMFSGSHTHHGPVLELVDEPDMGKGKFDDAVAYRAELEQKLIDVVVKAAENAVDAKIGWSSKEIDMNRNRHRTLGRAIR